MSIEDAPASDRIAHLHALQARGALVGYCRRNGMPDSVTQLLGLYRKIYNRTMTEQMLGGDGFFSSKACDGLLHRRYSNKIRNLEDAAAARRRRRMAYIAHLRRAKLVETKYGQVRALIATPFCASTDAKSSNISGRSKGENSAPKPANDDGHAMYTETKSKGRHAVRSASSGKFVKQKKEEADPKPGPAAPTLAAPKATNLGVHADQEPSAIAAGRADKGSRIAGCDASERSSEPERETSAVELASHSVPERSDPEPQPFAAPDQPLVIEAHRAAVDALRAWRGATVGQRRHRGWWRGHTRT